MAEYHLHAQVFSRAKGHSTLEAAAYRSGTKLRDERRGESWDYQKRRDVHHAEVVVPAGAPAWAQDREKLWNAVEHKEKRRDAGLAREIEFALPHELSREAQLALARAFIGTQFVAEGMVADWALHDKGGKPHVHCMLTTRSIGPDGFGPKRRDWDNFLDKRLILTWRAQWEHAANRALAQEGHEARIDHRSYAARGAALEAQPKRHRLTSRSTAVMQRRALAQEADFVALRARNGDRILRRPAMVLALLTSKRATFTERDVQRLVHQHTGSAAQFQRALHAVMASPELVCLGEDAHGTVRYSTRRVRALEQATLQDAHLLGQRGAHRVAPARIAQALRASAAALNPGQVAAVRYLATGPDLALVQGIAGSGKSRMLNAARLAWEAEGYIPAGGALAAIAAHGLQAESGIPSKTLHGWLSAWRAQRERLTSRHVFVIDEAGMLGTELFAQVAAEVRRAGAKLVVVGDTEQLRPIDHGAPMRTLAARYGAATLDQVIRQRLDWQKALTVSFAHNEAAAALEAYQAQGRVLGHASDAEARQALTEAWSAHRHTAPGETRLMLAFRRKDVRELNLLARATRKAAGELTKEAAFETDRGTLQVAVGERLYFLRNDRTLGVANGTLATVERIDGTRLVLRLDDHRQTVVDTATYRSLDYGYAATIHKSQGATVDRTFVLASRYMEAAATYVAMSRHRGDAHLFYSQTEFARPDALIKSLSRRRVEPTAYEASALAARRLATRLGQDARFFDDAESARMGAVGTLRTVADYATRNPAVAFAQLPQVRAAEREVRDAQRTLATATRTLDELDAAQPLWRKLRPGARQPAVDAVTGATETLRQAEARRTLVFGNKRLRARAQKMAIEHNRTLRLAQARLADLSQLQEQRARDSELGAIATAKNERTVGVVHRAALPLDAGAPLALLAAEQIGSRRVLVLADPRTPGTRIVAEAAQCIRVGTSPTRWAIQPGATRTPAPLLPPPSRTPSRER